MAKTPFVDLKSEDILSAHISGLQHIVNKVETVLDMKTTIKNGHVLQPVVDQADPTLHNFIYEGTVRNWITTPAPIIRRNGVIIPSSEYIIQPAYGVVVFKVQESAENVITADFTHIHGVSGVIQGLNDSISTLESNVDTLQKDVNTLKTTGGGGGVASGANAFHLPNTWRSHMAAVTTPTPMYATGVNTGPNNMDVFPFWVAETTTYDKMRISINDVSVVSDVKLAVYNSLNGYPYEVVAETIEKSGTISFGNLELPFADGDLTLAPGMYWLAKWNGAAIKMDNCLYNTQAAPLGETSDTDLLDANSTPYLFPVGAIRLTVAYDGVFRSPFWTTDQGAKYIKRATYCSPWIHKKA